MCITHETGTEQVRIHDPINQSTTEPMLKYTDLQIQKAVSVYMKNKQLLPFGFARQHTS